MAEVSYMIGNNKQVSFHEAVDDYRVVQGMPHNRNSWNAGDGNGFGNRKTIAIEICYSKSGGERFDKAERNAAKRIAQILKEHNWGIDKVGKHQDRSGKYCPHRTLDLGWERFLNMIREELGITQESANITTTKYKVGDIVSINGVYKSSNDTNRLNPAKKQGTITRIVAGTRNPYLLENGNIGWVNDDCIISSNAPAPAQPQPVPEPKKDIKTIGNCSMLNLRNSAGYGNNIYKAVKAGTQVEYLGMENGWAKVIYEGRTLFCGKNYLK